MMRSIVCLAATVALSGCATMAPTPATGIGSRVLAEWQGSGNWWVGTVSVGHHGLYTVSFDDGTKQALSADRIEPLTWGVGSPITCMGSAGRIVAYDPAERTLTIEGEDAVKTSYATGACYEERGVVDPG